MEQLINNGIIALNQSSLTEKPEKTVIILGAARSGTSMMAQVVEAMGVFIGEKKDGAVFEDVEIASLIEARKVEGLKQLVSQRNAKYPIWGWKRPASFDHLSWILPLLRNPHLVFMFRDPLAIALRNNISMDSDVLKSLRESNDTYAQIIRFLGQTKVPSLLVSYEKSLLKRARFIQHTAAFLGMENINVDAVTKKIELDRPIYLSSSTIKKVSGHVGIREGTILTGSVKAPLGKANLDVSVVGEAETKINTLAIESEESLKLDLSPHLLPGYNRIVVKEKQGGMHLNGSPLMIFFPESEKERKLMFADIPKTSGNFRNLLNDAFAPEAVFPNQDEIRENGQRYPPLSAICKVAFERLHKIKLVKGHYMSDVYRPLPFQWDIAVFFRTPVERLLSHLRHFKEYDKNCQGMSLPAIFEQRKNILENLQVKYIAADLVSDERFQAMSQEEFSSAITPVLKNLKFLGLTARFQESVDLFEKVFNLQLKKVHLKNEPAETVEGLGAAFIKDIGDFLQKENWLYALVEKEFGARYHEG